MSDALTEMPWIRWLDLDIDVSNDGAITVGLRRPKPEHLNHHGSINAAVAYGVGEVAGAGAAVVAAGEAAGAFLVAIRSGSIEYATPAHGGVLARACLDAELSADIAARTRVGASLDVPVSVNLADVSGGNTGSCSFVVAFRRRRTTT